MLNKWYRHEYSMYQGTESGLFPASRHGREGGLGSGVDGENGDHGRSRKALEAHEDFKYFQLFLQKKAPVIQKELERFQTFNRLTGSQKSRQKELLQELELVKKY
ncbi:hypothetical protein PF001_g33293, partial [Phytophthora fragariae]